MPVIAIGIAMASSLPVDAEDAPEATAANTELLAALAERDRRLEAQAAVIADLLRRVEQLERSKQPPAASAPTPPMARQAAFTPAAGSGPAPAGPETASAPSRQQKSVGKLKPAPAERAPGEFEVDKEAAERALERALVQQGALLLPFSQVEIEPFFSYSRREKAPAVFLVRAENAIAAANATIRTNSMTGGVNARIGLPWDTQLELSVPFEYEDTSSVTQSPFTGTEEDSNDAFGLGDASIGLAKTLLREKGWRPDLIAGLTWDSDTGKENDGVTLGSGFHELTGSLVALKRQDPLAFVGSFFYSTSFAKNDVDPSDEFGLSIGTVLAASPETSLQFFLRQSFSDDIEVNGQKIPGSDQVSGTLSLGASSILGPGILLSLTGGVGLTEDAPDYFVRVSLPIRLDLPFR